VKSISDKSELLNNRRECGIMPV